MKLFYILLSIYLTSILVGCGTDTSSDSSSTQNTQSSSSSDELTITNSNNNVSSETSSISLKITDSPIDNAAKVVITIISIELLKNDLNSSVLFTFNEPKAIDLLTLQGTNTENLLDNIIIESGGYSEIRLVVDDSASQSYIKLLDGNQYDLKIPSGSSSGLKLKGSFVAVSNQPLSYTIDFDVRKSIVQAGNSNNYLLKPVLRMVDNSVIGHIKGTVDSSLLTDASCSDSDVDSNNAVYVYLGSNVIPDDINIKLNLNIEPIATGSIKYDANTDQYIYEAAYLEAGDYTIAITCNADLEDIESDDELNFFNIQNVTVQVINTEFL